MKKAIQWWLSKDHRQQITLRDKYLSKLELTSINIDDIMYIYKKEIKNYEPTKTKMVH